MIVCTARAGRGMREGENADAKILLLRRMCESIAEDEDVVVLMILSQMMRNRVPGKILRQRIDGCQRSDALKRAPQRADAKR